MGLTVKDTENKAWAAFRAEVLAVSNGQNMHVAVGILPAEESQKTPLDRPAGSPFRTISSNPVGPPGGGPPGGGSSGEPLTLAEIAVIHEFGTSTIPARSFIRATIERHREEIEAMQAKLLKKMLPPEKMLKSKALGLFGTFLAGLIKRSISSAEDMEPLKRPRANGSSHPLVDTGQLLNGITWAVRNRGETQ